MVIDSFEAQYRFLSSFYPCRGVLGGSVEHAYQADKFIDESIRAAILQEPSPGVAKRMARHYKAFVRDDWEQINMGRMWFWICAKYNIHRNPDLRSRLVATDGYMLIEGNLHHDNFWGDCHCMNVSGKHPECLIPGKNYLGLMLMERRDQCLGRINE